MFYAPCLKKRDPGDRLGVASPRPSPARDAKTLSPGKPFLLLPRPLRPAPRGRRRGEAARPTPGARAASAPSPGRPKALSTHRTPGGRVPFLPLRSPRSRARSWELPPHSLRGQATSPGEDAPTHQALAERPADRLEGRARPRTMAGRAHRGGRESKRNRRAWPQPGRGRGGARQAAPASDRGAKETLAQWEWGVAAARRAVGTTIPIMPRRAAAPSISSQGDLPQVRHRKGESRGRSRRMRSGKCWVCVCVFFLALEVAF